MATFYCPIELTGAAYKHLPLTRRFFFIEVDAVDAMDAMRQQREEAATLFPEGRREHTAICRWAPSRDLPSFEYMAAMRRGLDASKGKSPKARERAVSHELDAVMA